MLEHEQFGEFCALAATGQLSPGEQVQLIEHLEDCASCRAAYDEFSLILRELPAAEEHLAGKALLRRIEKSGLRERFLDRARFEGIRFSTDVEKPHRAPRLEFPRLIPIYQWVVAGVMVAILIGVAGYREIGRIKWPSHIAPPQSEIAPDSQGNTKNAVLAAKISELQSLRDVSERTISGLRSQNASLRVRLQNLDKRLAATQNGMQDLKEMLAQENSTNAQLTSREKENAQLLARTREELEKVRADRSETLAALAMRERTVDELSQNLSAQKASLERERVLLAAGRDITDLMGARSLHIIDVHDVDGRGRNKKSFGRVFYTEGKSLIFYAFDLDEKRLADARYSFEAWGERIGQPTTVNSLGMLYVDDKAQKRWVLKVDDPQQLAEIDSVFVTLEPNVGGDKPRGQKILYAFLGSKANHP